jgi:protein-L-isoaspartate(D-aspartate) O-methyltransferase
MPYKAATAARCAAAASSIAATGSQAMDYATARTNMILSQLRPNRVVNEAIISAFDEIPREQFVPRHLRSLAYIDEDVEISPGRYLMEPMVLARMLQAAELRAGETVLDVAAGSGYASAVIARLAGTVVALDSEADLVEEANARFNDLGLDNAVAVQGDLTRGYPKEAPYDLIFINGAVEVVPEPLFEQLGEGGRLMAVVREPGRTGQATMMVRQGDNLSRRPLFDASTPILPGFEKPRGFRF